ncbi:UrcA family protein [Sphingomonas oleivorans]|nr:UrcA family protein [Sphingomonas oleivorans]
MPTPRSGPSPRPSWAIAIAAILSFGASAAHADPQIQVDATSGDSITRTKIVHTDDLNLASPVAQRRLELRIARAAREVCGYSSMHGLRPPESYLRCEEGALAGAARQWAPLQKSAERDSGRSSIRLMD